MIEERARKSNQSNVSVYSGNELILLHFTIDNYQINKKEYRVISITKKIYFYL